MSPAAMGAQAVSETQSVDAQSGDHDRDPCVRYRPRGRPRSRLADAKIRDAVLSELASGSYTALTIEAVARHSGVARTTIYRRYRTKSSLVGAAMENLVSLAMAPAHNALDDVEDADGAVTTARIVLREVIGAYLANPDLLGAVQRLFAEASVNTEVDELVHHLGEPLNDRLTEVLEAGQRRGELPPDFDVEIGVDMLLSVLPFRLLITGTDIGPDLADRLIDTLFYAWL